MNIRDLLHTRITELVAALDALVQSDMIATCHKDLLWVFENQGRPTELTAHGIITVTYDRMTSHDVIAAHRGNHATNKTDLWTACRCGDGVRYYNPSDHARHVLAALKAEGYAVVELPSAVPGWWNCYEDDGDPPDHNAFSDGECGEFMVTTWFSHPGEVQVSHPGEPLEPLSVAEARALAAALLAAADATEEGK